MVVGTKLKGKTKKHPHMIVIIGISAQKYQYRILGGQHGRKKEQYICRAILEAHYHVIKL